MNAFSSLLMFIGHFIGRFHISNTEPTAADGQDGDIWFVYDDGE